MLLSIIVPVLNESGRIVAALRDLAPLRSRGAEIIVVDGGSDDGTAALARRCGMADAVLDAPRGRALQMNAGAAEAHGEVLLFLHADTQLPGEADRLIAAALAGKPPGRRGRAWGRFDVRIDGAHPLLAVVAKFMNWRSRATGIATGDQAMFVSGEAFRRSGGFPPIALMEDIVMSQRLKRLSPPACIAARATTSGRRWEAHGVVRTVIGMWWRRARFFLGAAPGKLAAGYDPVRHAGRNGPGGQARDPEGGER